MVATKSDALSLIESMSDVDFSKLCIFLNKSFSKDESRKQAEEKFVNEVHEAEKSVAKGNYVTLSQLHDFLGV